MNGPCPDRQDSIADYVLGALDREQAEVLREHLADCHDCRAYLHSLEQQGEALAALGRRVEADAKARQDRVIRALEDAGPVRKAPVLAIRLARLAVAAVFVLGAGIVIGRITARPPVDVEQLRADVETSILASLTSAVRQEADARVQTALSAREAELQAEIVAQVREDLRVLAAQLVSGTEARMDQRLAELVELIEAARRTDRQRVAKALEQMQTKMGMGLYSLAARTNDLPRGVPN
jgi:anti-sigma factor RsiW